MLQKFNVDTLGGRFIKSLLAQTPIPVFDSVVDGDYIVKDCYYVYKTNIIKCTASGMINEDGKFDVVSFVDTTDYTTCNVFNSLTNYYDSETHYHLGRYLRYLHTSTGLNLMPFYNCYNSSYFNDIELTVDNGNIKLESVMDSTQHRIVAIPILFGKTYKIFIDCSSQVLMRACLHDKYHSLETEAVQEQEDLFNILEDSGVAFPSLRFNHPVSFSINCDKKQGINYQRYLFLVIQLPPNNTSSIFVQEGEFEYLRPGIIGIQDDVYNTRNKLSPSRLAQINSSESYAFSDRLIEYLLGNVVHEGDQIAKNISNVQSAILQYFPQYGKLTKIKRGVWDDMLSGFVLKLVLENYNTDLYYDHDGNINRDVEALLYSKGIDY